MNLSDRRPIFRTLRAVFPLVIHSIERHTKQGGQSVADGETRAQLKLSSGHLTLKEHNGL
jgi:hypothetical protein